MPRYDVLQVLRGIAALLVVIDHAILAALPDTPTYAAFREVGGSLGRLGVNTFFIMSGFIIVHSTAGMYKMKPAERFTTFVRRRMTRLVPLYWIVSGAMIVFLLVQSQAPTMSHVLLSFAFLPNFLMDVGDYKLPPVLGVGWSLNYEMFFYVIFAFGLLLRRTAGILASLAVIGILILAGPKVLPYIVNPELHRLVAFYTFKNMMFFAVGICLAVIHPNLPSINGRFAGTASGVVLISAVAVRAMGNFPAVSMKWQAISLFACTMSVVLAICGRTVKDRGIDGALLHAGNASYATYLVHALVLHLLMLALPSLSIASAAAFVIVGTVLSHLVGSSLHLFVEIPLQRLIRPASERRTVALQA